MKKTVFLAIAMLLVLSLLFVACEDEKDPQPPTQTDEQTSEQVSEAETETEIETEPETEPETENTENGENA